jgi:hypothetical protein
VGEVKTAVKNIEFTAFDAKRFAKKEERPGKIRIDTNSTVTQISEKNDKEAEVEFTYTITYSGTGVIKIDGRLVYEGDARSVAQQWGEKRNMPNEAAGEIHTAIIRGCIPEAVLIAKSLNLQLPIPLPSVNIKEKRKGAETSGMEVA